MFIDKKNIEKHSEGQTKTLETPKYLKILIMGLFVTSLLITVVVSFFPMHEYNLILIFWDLVPGIWIAAILNLYSIIKTKKGEYKRAIRVTIIAIILYVFNFIWVGIPHLYRRWGDFSYVIIGSMVILIINMIILAITSSKFSDTQKNQYIKIFTLKSPKRFLILIIALELIIAVLFFFGLLIYLSNKFFPTTFMWIIFYFIIFTITDLSIIFLIKSKFIGVKLSLLSLTLGTVPIFDIIIYLLGLAIFPAGWRQIYLMYVILLIPPLLFLVFPSIKIYKNRRELKDYLQSKK